MATGAAILGTVISGGLTAYLVAQMLLDQLVGTRGEREGIKLSKEQSRNEALTNAMLVNQEASREASGRREVAADRARQLASMEKMQGAAQESMMLQLLSGLMGGQADYYQDTMPMGGPQGPLPSQGINMDMARMGGLPTPNNIFSELGL